MSDRHFHFVDVPEKLAGAAELLAGQRELGIDAEMNGLHAFKARVCVLQISTETADVVVDTVRVKDLGPVRDALVAPGAIRYAHGAAHDVKCLKQDFGIGIEGLFDTYVASQLLGVEKLGYGDIVATRYGATLDKALQTADWGRRPLTPAQVEYLRGDVRYLIPLGRELAAELKARDLLEEAQYEFSRVAALPADPDESDPEAWLRVKETRDLPPVGQSILRELVRARDGIARRMDRPPFKVAGEKTLLDIARAKPATAEELAKIPGLPRQGNARLAQELFEAVARGIAAGAPPPRPPAPRLEGEEVRARRAREEALRGWRKKIATAKKLPPMAVLPSYTLEDLVRAPARSIEDLGTRPGMIPKRLRLYGEEILAALAPRGAGGAAASPNPGGTP
jgi:ribonuclease D